MGGRDRSYRKSCKGASRRPQAGSAVPESETDKHLAKILAILKRRFKKGDKTAILKAIQQCFQMKKPVPEWLRLAFLQAYDAATGYEIKSWAEVFGAVHPKGTHLKKERRSLMLRGSIVGRVQELKAAGFPIDKLLFETIGKEFGLSGTTASEIYYDERTQIVRELFDILTKGSSGKN